MRNCAKNATKQKGVTTVLISRKSKTIHQHTTHPYIQKKPKQKQQSLDLCHTTHLQANKRQQSKHTHKQYTKYRRVSIFYFELHFVLLAFKINKINKQPKIMAWKKI